MRSVSFFFAFFIACFILMHNECRAEKTCPPRTRAVDTPQGKICVCTGGYYGENCEKTGRKSHVNCHAQILIRIVSRVVSKDKSASVLGREQHGKKN